MDQGGWSASAVMKKCGEDYALPFPLKIKAVGRIESLDAHDIKMNYETRPQIGVQCNGPVVGGTGRS